MAMTASDFFWEIPSSLDRRCGYSCRLWLWLWLWFLILILILFGFIYSGVLHLR